ncbi:PPOX class F420-dependent oxidoreductase [Yinghuangia sp. ASG 101]|uniref:PPOX class F420-dependent oxidoreductase n=1 Tax=Yinghuangia sp. ASG 101 TaxID=2896848 RepID=UPI001E2B2246|nr:PPOX class F420-dependent oxidoreductase [Yinghuangia sp. ASG 101]UGQ13102.1 PPOX class F420-dependent oxidoreductase [Yinghuangia sp. ASG 101]
MTSTTAFSPAELAYLLDQRLGRLATVAPDGTLQNNPVGYTVDNVRGTIEIRGYTMGASRKFRNVAENPEIAFVVDDIASLDPWTVRGIEIRGTAEAVRGEKPAGEGLSPDIIRIHPRRVVAWGIDPESPGMAGRAFRRPA